MSVSFVFGERATTKSWATIDRGDKMAIEHFCIGAQSGTERDGYRSIGDTSDPSSDDRSIMSKAISSVEQLYFS